MIRFTRGFNWFMVPLLFAGCLAGGEDALPGDNSTDDGISTSAPDRAPLAEEPSATDEEAREQPSPFLFHEDRATELDRPASGIARPDEPEVLAQEPEIAGEEIVPVPSDATPCVSGASCSNGNCVDGFCCDMPCTGLCMACSAAKKGAGPDGVCGPIAAGVDPDQECADNGPASCGQNGLCNGNGGCESYAVGTLCHASSCAGAVLTKADLCDGNGTCIDSGVQDCAPFNCSLKGCYITCTSNAQCSTNAYCANNTCVFKRLDGNPCADGSQCQSDHCADGVCCDTPCDGTCEACTAERKGGGADGKCEPILADHDPDDECPDLGVGSCGTNGWCSGNGTCALYPDGAVCNGGSCDGTMLTQADHCDGQGACIDGGTADCGLYKCATDGCPTSCATNEDCVSMAFCLGSLCLLKLPDGVPCDAKDQCASGNCADGVCCNETCDGLCEACTAAAKGSGINGVCEPVAAGTDPGDDCDEEPATSCGKNGACDGAGQCQIYPAGTSCAAATCAGPSTATPASLCDGSGTCVSQDAVDCGLYLCGGGACKMPCDADSDCVPSAFCDDHVCTEKPAPTCMEDCDGGSDGSVEPPPDGGAGGSVEPALDGGADGSVEPLPDSGDGDAGSIKPVDKDDELPGLYSCATAPRRATAGLPIAALAGLSLAVLARRRRRARPTSTAPITAR